MTLRRLLQGLSIALVLAPGIGGCETDTQTDTQTDRQVTQACTDLVLDYALYRDQLDAENLAALFTKDARLSVQGNEHNSNSKTVRGSSDRHKLCHCVCSAFCW